MADVKKLAEEIVGLTLLEAVELKNILKDEYGIEAASGGAVMVAGPTGGAGDSGGAAEEKSEFDIILKAAGDKKINVIKGSSNYHRLRFKRKKDLVESWWKGCSRRRF